MNTVEHEGPAHTRTRGPGAVPDSASPSVRRRRVARCLHTSPQNLVAERASLIASPHTTHRDAAAVVATASRSASSRDAPVRHFAEQSTASRRDARKASPHHRQIRSYPPSGSGTLSLHPTVRRPDIRHAPSLSSTPSLEEGRAAHAVTKCGHAKRLECQTCCRDVCHGVGVSWCCLVGCPLGIDGSGWAHGCCRASVACDHPPPAPRQPEHPRIAS